MSNLKIKTPRWALPLLEPARFKVVYSGRGLGKSYFFAGLLIEEHIQNPDQRSLCIRAVQNAISQSVKQLIEELIDVYGVADHFDIQATEIKNKKGKGVMMFKGLQQYNSSNIKSFQGVDRAWIEEAVDISQKAWDDLEPTIRKKDSQIWVSYNPLYETDPIDKIFRGDNPPDDAIIVTANIFDNPWASEANMKSMEHARKHDIDRFQHVWMGGYLKNSDKRIYKNFSVQEFDTPAEAEFYYGCDLGFSVDPTVLVRCFIEGRKLFIDYEAREIGCDTVDLPNLFLQVPMSELFPITIDSSRPETISHLKKNGFRRARGSVKGAHSVIEGIEYLRSFEIIVHPRCKGMIDDLTHYSYKVDSKTDEITPYIDHKNSDGCDALRYAVEKVRRTSKANTIPTSRPVKTVRKWK